MTLGNKQKKEGKKKQKSYFETMEFTNRIYFLIIISIVGSANADLRKSSAQNNQRELNILEALNVSGSMRGVKEVSWSNSEGKLRAWRFHSSFDHVQLPTNLTSDFLSKLNDELSIVYTYKQHRKTSAALFSINSPGKLSPWLRLISDTKRNQLLLDYRVNHDPKLHQIKIDFNRCKAKGQPIHDWTNLKINLSGNWMNFTVGCCSHQPIQRSLQLSGKIYFNFPLDSLIYFRQEPGFKKKLLGAVKVAKLANYADDLTENWKCFS
ncbi:hypothetical protein CHUAL_000216 [Chamberlinius hualienensis]